MQPDPQIDLEALLREEPYVRALARVLCAGNEDEIVQQTWLQACSHRGKRIQQPRAWLASIGRNVTKNLLRREGRTKKREQLAAKSGVDAEANKKGETRSAWLLPLAGETLLGAPTVATAPPVDAAATTANALPTGVIAGAIA
jgi:DNA-directed RNA polymerase specialized sigma24 family protein